MDIMTEEERTRFLGKNPEVEKSAWPAVVGAWGILLGAAMLLEVLGYIDTYAIMHTAVFGG